MATILCIDDDDMICKILAAGFETAGYEVITVSDGKSGIEKANEVKPDLVVTDLNMPNMTGWQVLEALKQNPETSSIPVVVLSAHKTGADYDEACEKGCAAYCQKPIDLDDLLAKVDSILAG